MHCCIFLCGKVLVTTGTMLIHFLRNGWAASQVEQDGGNVERTSVELFSVALVSWGYSNTAVSLWIIWDTGLIHVVCWADTGTVEPLKVWLEELLFRSGCGLYICRLYGEMAIGLPLDARYQYVFHADNVVTIQHELYPVQMAPWVLFFQQPGSEDRSAISETEYTSLGDIKLGRSCILLSEFPPFWE